MAAETAYLFFDVDNTLYRESTGILDMMNERIGRYVCEYLAVDPDTAARLRQDNVLEYGSTLNWLRMRHGMDDPEEYIAWVHDLPLESLIARDEAIIRMLDTLDTGRSILTNSPAEHAERVLSILGIRDQFDHLFDIRYNNFRGKPYPDLFDLVTEVTGIQYADSILIDDVPGYLYPLREKGGQGILVDELKKYPQTDLPVLRVITDLPDVLGRIKDSDNTPG